MQWELIHVVCINHEQSHIDLRRGVEVFVRQLEGKNGKGILELPSRPFPLAPDYSPPLECPLPPPLHQDTQDTDVPIDQCTEDIYC